MTMNYRLHYDLLIAKARSENRKKLRRKNPDYMRYESHHIVPGALGGSDDESNRVLLTAREHFVAHWLLTKFKVGQDRHAMLFVLARMSADKTGRRLTSRQIEICSKAKSLAMTELNAKLVSAGEHAFQSEQVKSTRPDRSSKAQLARVAKGSHSFQDPEFIASNAIKTKARNLDLSNRGLLPFQQPKFKAEQSIRITKFNSLAVASKTHSFQRPEVIASNAAKSSIRQQIVHQCPHCDRQGKGMIMFRHHFDNCKHKP